jgi:hypothetical protein
MSANFVRFPWLSCLAGSLRRWRAAPTEEEDKFSSLLNRLSISDARKN